MLWSTHITCSKFVNFTLLIVASKDSEPLHGPGLNNHFCLVFLLSLDPSSELHSFILFQYRYTVYYWKDSCFNYSDHCCHPIFSCKISFSEEIYPVASNNNKTYSSNIMSSSCSQPTDETDLSCSHPLSKQCFLSYRERNPLVIPKCVKS